MSLGNLRLFAAAVVLLLLFAALAVPTAWAAPATPATPAVPAGDISEDPFRWRKGNLGWLEPMLVDAVRGERLEVHPGFFAESMRQRAKMSPNHQALWRSLRYTAAVRGDGGELGAERAQLEEWFLRQRRNGLQLDEPGGYIQVWSAASALAALAAWEDVARHPGDPDAERTARTVLGWWRDFGAYYGRLRTEDGALLRVGARQNHRPRDAAFDQVLLDLLLEPPAAGPHPDTRWMARKREHAWMRRGLGAWTAREVMERGVPLAEVARDGLRAPLPRISNPVTLKPGEWAWMPVISGRGPLRWASWSEDGGVGFSGHPKNRRVYREVWTAPEAPRWNLRTGMSTGPDAALAPLPELPERPRIPTRRSESR